MAESITQPDMNQNENNVQTVETTFTDNRSQVNMPLNAHTFEAQARIIWTPAFIIVFVLTLVVGLSLASLLTQGWANHYYAAEWVLITNVTLIFGSWLVTALRARSPWIRMGAIFGCIWAIFTNISFILSLLAVDSGTSVVAHLNAGTNSALLGAYICLSIARTPLQRWDTWFFRLAPILGACIIALVYLLIPPETRAPTMLESVQAAVALYLCIAIWWLRASCWKTQPGPAFLFGTTPVILLILAIPNFVGAEANFFFLQIFFLGLLLGILRILQGEMRS